MAFKVNLESVSVEPMAKLVVLTQILPDLLGDFGRVSPRACCSGKWIPNRYA